MLLSYTCLLNEMVPALWESGLITEQTKLYVPAFPPLLSRLETHAIVQFVESIQANEYPLYQATERVRQKWLGNSTNADEIEQLESAAPFKRITFKSKDDTDSD